MSGMRRILWAPLALCVIPLVSACGSDDSGGDSPGGSGGVSGSGGTAGGGTGGGGTGGSCTPTTCVAAGAECGTIDDGCGSQLECGACTAPDTCDANNQCVCTPTTCADEGANCGSIPDGCGATLECGTCTAPETCGGGGTPNVCGEGTCTPTTCADEGAECGMISDGCSDTLDCGTCTAPESCGGGGEDNVCGCTPTTCTDEGAECGSIDDGCGGTLDCGNCTAPETCGGGGTPNVCGESCTATTCVAENANCGLIDDGCGTTLDCGTCTAPEVCGGGGPNQCGQPTAWPAEGDLVISELMYNPSETPEDDYEWIEIHNPSTTETFNLAGCELSESTRSHTIAASLSIAPGDFVVLAGSNTPGFTPDYNHSREVFLVNNNNGSMTLTCGTAVIDTVEYDTSGGVWPNGTNGVAIALDPNHYDATDNDDGANWCLAEATYGTNGNYGTPGAGNSSCGCTPITACPSPLNCGDIDDGCGGTINCGNCTAPETCGGDGTANVCGQGSCTPTTCAAEGAECGTISDGCSGTLDCGNCTAPETCGGGGTDNVCGCTPTTCADEGANCGTIDDGCGNILNCGTCTAPQSCGGGGTDNVCGCTATTCTAQGAECGTIPNGCGTGTLNCGSCTLPETCGGGGTNNVCGCTPDSCADLGAECGTPPDGCGGTLSCGSCTAPETCGGGGTQYVCGAAGTYPAAGELVINEIMYNPIGTEPAQEWVELFNTTATQFELFGCVLAEGGGTHAIASSVVVPPNGYVTLGASAPGFTPTYTYSGISLNNTGGDTFSITCSTLVDSVTYGVSSPWPTSTNANSIALDPDRRTASANDFGVNWCLDGTSTYGTDGNFGTPGAANINCATTTYTINWCNTQFPASISAEEGSVATVYGRVYIAGLTDTTVNGLDENPNVIMQFGYGANGSDATTWDTWETATANVGVNNDDEYEYDVILPPSSGSPYDYQYRVTGNGGLTWSYCDVNGYDPGNGAPASAQFDAPGEMITTPATIVPTLIISEYIEGTSNNKAIEIYNATSSAIDMSGCSLQIYTNGGTTPSSISLTTAGTLANAATWVVCHSSSSQTILDACDQQTGSLSFNGDDAVVLVCNSATIDGIGQVGVDPGTEWGTGNASTSDNTIRRNCSVTTGDSNTSDAFDPATQWTGFPTDTFDGLGAHTTC